MQDTIEVQGKPWEALATASPAPAVQQPTNIQVQGKPWEVLSSQAPDPVATQVEDMLQSPAEEAPVPPKAKPTVEEHAQYIANRRQAESKKEGPKLRYEDLEQDVEFQEAVRRIREVSFNQNPDEYSAQDNLRDWARTMRRAMSNEIDAVRTLRMIQNASDEDKLHWRTLFQRYQDLPDFWQEGGAPASQLFLDMVESSLASPATWLSILTGGAAKIAGAAGTTSARAAIQGALLGGSIDAAAGAVTDRIFQEAELQAGARDSIDRLQTGLSAVLSAAPGAAGGALKARDVNIRTRRWEEANEAAKAAREAELTAARQNTIQNRYTPEVEVSDIKMGEIAKDVSSDLEKFFKGESEKGRELLEMINPRGELTEAALREDISKSIAVAVKDMVEAGNLTLSKDKDLRVGWQVWQAIADGKLSVDQYAEALTNAGLRPDDFKTLLWSEVSRSGRVLNAFSQIARASRTVEEASVIHHYFGGEAADVLARLTEDESSIGALRRNLHRLDQTRIGLMITQPATAMRNFGGSVGYVGMEAGARAFDNGLALLTGRRPVKFGDAFNVIGHMMNRTETRLLAEEITRLKPKEQQLLFKTYNEVNRQLGKSEGAWGVVDQVVDWLNVFNRFQDHLFRQSAFVASVERQLNDIGGPSLKQLMKDGRLADVDAQIIDRAMHEAMRATFTDEPTNQMAKGMLEGIRKINENVPFTLTQVLPFPRFMFSALKFQYEYSPLGLIDVLGKKGRAKLAKGDAHDLGKAIVGTATLGGALLARHSEYAGENWYEIIGDDGTAYDIRPIFPLAPYFYVADLVKRVNEGTFFTGNFIQDVLEATAGVSFRQTVDMTTVNGLIKSLQSDGSWTDKTWRSLAELVADTGASFLIPTSTVRDIQAQFDPELRYMRDARGQGFWDTLENRVNDRIPNLEFLGFGETGRGVLPDRQSALRGPTQQYQDPLLKQMTGMTAYEAPNIVEQEFARLKLREWDVFKPSGNQEFDRNVLYFFGTMFERHAAKAIQSDWYQSLTPTQQRHHLTKLGTQKFPGGWSMMDFARELATLSSPAAAMDANYRRKSARERAVIEEALSRYTDDPEELRNMVYRLYYGIAPNMSEIEQRWRYLTGSTEEVMIQQMQDLMSREPIR